MTAASAHAHHGAVPTGIGRRATAGVLGGLAGGLVFGALMAMMGMLATIASMVGSSSPWVGFGVHLMISILIGLALAVPFAALLNSYGKGALVGLGYGLLWWILGPLLIMPMMMGMPLFTINAMALMSLMGHLIYGVILAVVAVRVFQSKS
ncbi:hypothetical protein [Arthrobacter monumenti]